MAVGWRWVQKLCGCGVRVCRTPIPMDVGWRGVQDPSSCGVRMCRTPIPIAKGWRWVQDPKPNGCGVGDAEPPKNSMGAEPPTQWMWGGEGCRTQRLWGEDVQDLCAMG